MPSNYTLLNHDENWKPRTYNLNVVKPLPTPSHMFLRCEVKCPSLGASTFFHEMRNPKGPRPVKENEHGFDG